MALISYCIPSHVNLLSVRDRGIWQIYLRKRWPSAFTLSGRELAKWWMKHRSWKPLAIEYTWRRGRWTSKKSEYPLVNVFNITMEDHHVSWVNQLYFYGHVQQLFVNVYQTLGCRDGPPPLKRLISHVWYRETPGLVIHEFQWTLDFRWHLRDWSFFRFWGVKRLPEV